MNALFYEGTHAFSIKKTSFCLFVMALFCATQSLVAQPIIGKKQFHLYLLAGQSNMAGRGKVEAEDTTRHPRIWVLTKNNDWQLATEPLHFDKPNIVGVGIGFAFAKKMAELDTNIVIGLIPCSVGGSPIEMWQPTKYYEPTKSYPYDDALKRAQIAMQRGTLKGILWHQGESDSDSIKAKAYAHEQIAAIINKFEEFNVWYLPVFEENEFVGFISKTKL